ncbi:DedA family protein [Sphingobium sp. BYY-5]|uniref:DedA family protein n=1 Tax=Sphingobium sp. BYY-5 TaxID=2926400 RepID=UPI001FA7FD02|nr:DedA family protein [Sphingobium sp. BYY-5]MCI4592083.1 DedA family protein [Sphingobium sp. BYY-5]
MSEFILDTITRYAGWAGLIVGVLAFLESMVVIGLFIPAIATMIAVGGLIGAGLIDPAPILVGALAGAILGDWLSYMLGRALGPAIYRHRWLKGHRLALARARLAFRRYGFISVLLGRFLGPLRATIPLVAGVLKMPQIPFQAANILSALLWIPALLAPGYFAGSEAMRWGFGVEHMLPIVVGLCLLPLGLGWIAVTMLNRPRQRACRQH